MYTSPELEVVAANSGLLAPSATDLVVLVENGETEKMLERVQMLSQRDYIDVLRAIQAVETALGDYALSWKGSEYWGRGENFPDEQKTAAVEKMAA